MNITSRPSSTTRSESKLSSTVDETAAQGDEQGDSQPPSADRVVYSDGVEPPKMFYVATVLGTQPWLAGQDILVSAGTAWKNPGQNGAEEGFDINIPEHKQLMVDSGGFQATAHFDAEYPYADTDLFVWAEDVGADYVTGMDFTCEEASVLESEVEAADADTIPSISERIERTIDKQSKQYALYTELADREGGWSFDFIPVVQGHSVQQYRYCAERLKEAGLATEYMAIGSVCKRADVDQILAVLDACRDVLPATEFHLFGATRRVWKDSRFFGAFRSSDTHAWGVSHPSGGWPSNNEEKAEAFAHFDADIQSVRETMKAQTAIGGQSNERRKRASRLPGNDMGGACAFCGSEVPAYGISFSPDCTACQRVQRNRTIHARAAVEHEVTPSGNVGGEATGDPTQSSLDDPAWKQESTSTEDG